MSRTFKLLVVGVGSQGILTGARILGRAGMAANLDVRVGQLHGLAQRGGSVEATLLVGPGDGSFIPQGEADVVVGMEAIETQRAMGRMSAKTIVLLNQTRIVPYTLTSRGEEGPSLKSITHEIRQVTPHLIEVDAFAAAQEIGSPLSLNIVMLGVLAALKLTPLPAAAIEETISTFGRSSLREINAQAYRAGIRLGEAVSPVTTT